MSYDWTLPVRPLSTTPSHQLFTLNVCVMSGAIKQEMYGKDDLFHKMQYNFSETCLTIMGVLVFK